MSELIPLDDFLGPRPCVYRLYDADGCLLYIGQSVDVVQRVRAHRSQQPWADEIATVKIEECRDVAEMNERELDAIFDEQPRYNVAGKGGVLPEEPEATCLEVRPFRSEPIVRREPVKVETRDAPPTIDEVMLDDETIDAIRALLFGRASAGEATR